MTIKIDSGSALILLSYLIHDNNEGQLRLIENAERETRKMQLRHINELRIVIATISVRHIQRESTVYHYVVVY